MPESTPPPRHPTLTPTSRKPIWPWFLAFGLLSLTILFPLYIWTADYAVNVPEIIMVTGIPLLGLAVLTVVGLVGAAVFFGVESYASRRARIDRTTR